MSEMVPSRGVTEEYVAYLEAQIHQAQILLANARTVSEVYDAQIHREGMPSEERLVEALRFVTTNQYAETNYGTFWHDLNDRQRAAAILAALNLSEPKEATK